MSRQVEQILGVVSGICSESQETLERFGEEDRDSMSS